MATNQNSIKADLEIAVNGGAAKYVIKCAIETIVKENLRV